MVAQDTGSNTLLTRRSFINRNVVEARNTALALFCRERPAVNRELKKSVGIVAFRHNDILVEPIVKFASIHFAILG
jgi:hypothetical protein